MISNDLFQGDQVKVIKNGRPYMIGTLAKRDLPFVWIKRDDNTFYVANTNDHDIVTND